MGPRVWRFPALLRTVTSTILQLGVGAGVGCKRKVKELNDKIGWSCGRKCTDTSRIKMLTLGVGFGVGCIVKEKKNSSMI